MGYKLMSNKVKVAIISGIFSLIGIVLGAYLNYYFGNTISEKNTVESLSGYVNTVDENTSYEEALQKILEELKNKEEEIEELQKENRDLQIQTSSMNKFEIRSTGLFVDGLKAKETINKSLVVVDNKNYYYSEEVLKMILKDKLSYDSSQDVIIYGNDSKETKVDLFSTNVLYDGSYYDTYLPTDGESFSMGSDTYTKGFVLKGDGYALFDLKGQYSKISFDVGRTNDGEKRDVKLKVYLNNEYVEEYSLSAYSPPISLEIDINHANDMKLEIDGQFRDRYGFANVLLHY